MNWMEIDRIIHNMITIYTDKEALYSDVKKKFNWSDSQCEAAVAPLLQRSSWYDKVIEEPTPKKVVKKKKPTKAPAKAKAKAPAKAPAKAKAKAPKKTLTKTKNKA
jgi:hypothetical protein|tara:strand:- start:2852 stop:3169 length:318 start_codon:yes stop_codon:yes gene_type:complete